MCVGVIARLIFECSDFALAASASCDDVGRSAQLAIVTRSRGVNAPSLTSPSWGGRNLQSKFRVGGSAGRLEPPPEKSLSRFCRPPHKGGVKGTVVARGRPSAVLHMA